MIDFTLAWLAHTHFGITLPVERSELKALYRRAARRLHPDLNTSNPHAETMFKELQAAYDALCDGAGVFTDGPKIECTEEGTPLTGLGLGLGPRKNGRECQECKGAGYHKKRVRKIVWTPKPPCQICCALGSTWGCVRCRYLDYHHKDEIVTVNRVCAPCQGCGEIEIFNPVIPKGLLTAGSTHLGQKARKRLAQGNE